MSDKRLGLLRDAAAGTKTRKEVKIAEKADVLGVRLIGKRIPSGSYRAVCSGSVVRNLLKYHSEKVFVITSDIIVGGRHSGDMCNTLITKDYRLYFKKWDSSNELKVYELHEVTSSKDIHLISGLAIISIDAKKLRRRSGILKYRPFTSEETERSSLGGSVCQIVVGNTDAFAVAPYDLEDENGEYVLKLPEKGINFKTWTELTGGGANSSSLHPRGAVFLRDGKAVGFLTFLNGKISPVFSSQFQTGFGTVVTTTNQEGTSAVVSEDDQQTVDVHISAEGTSTNQEGIKAGTSTMVSEDVLTLQNIDVDGADQECSPATLYDNCSDQELFGMEDLEPTEPLLKPKNSKEAHNASSDSAGQNPLGSKEQGPSRSTASGQQGSKGIPGIAADVRSKGRGRGTLTDIPGTTEVRGRGRSAPRMEKPTQYNGGESIRIEVHPSSQNQKEGSRVELRCKIQGRNDATYQWFKDGGDLKGQNRSTLVLNPVKMRDFGFYVCKVRYTDNRASSICVESCPAELNVAPRDGMRFKQLSEIRLCDAGYKLEKLLSVKIHGRGGWKQVAIKYKMDALDIALLAGDQQAATANVLMYLEAHNPDLTVYEFCKFLKEPSIRRHDIVKELLDHLSVNL